MKMSGCHWPPSQSVTYAHVHTYVSVIVDSVLVNWCCSLGNIGHCVAYHVGRKGTQARMLNEDIGVLKCSPVRHYT